MKTRFTLLAIFALLFTAVSYGVPDEKTDELLFQYPVIYGSFAPVDHSVGARLDLPYGYVSYSALGDYTFYDASKLKKHERISIGLAYNKLTIGVASHRFCEATVIGTPPEVFMKKHSIEIGFRHEFKTLVCAVRYDTFRHEVVVDVGVGLKYLKFK